MESRYIVVTINSWSDKTEAKAFEDRSTAIEYMECKYVAAILRADFVEESETFINDHYAQISDGMKVTEFRMAEI